MLSIVYGGSLGVWRVTVHQFILVYGGSWCMYGGLLYISQRVNYCSSLMVERLKAILGLGTCVKLVSSSCTLLG